MKRALENDISIYTIGFGDYVSDEYLEALSAYTGGSYYRIYSSRDLRWIFNDIYKKLNNYYAISFKINTIGEHELILKICIDQSEPLITTFNNTPLPPIDSLVDKDYKHIDLIPDTFFVEEPELEKILKDLEPVLLVDNNDSLTIIEEFNRLKFPDIRFVFDKTIIVPDTDKGLEDVISFLEKYPHTGINITGHTDSLGSDAYNIDLSIRRAEKIKNLMVEEGINAKRIFIQGKGENLPRISNKNQEGRSLNRRVEFKLILSQA
ncbi:Peptidoglycan-associated lipoprotein [subsurface metagenome]